MVYFDNSATGGFKPNSVIKAGETVIKYLSANPLRSGHRLSVTGGEIVYDCRKVLADFFGATPQRVIFTKNCTEALNLAIFGTVKKGGHVITTVFEHNSVLRPLYYLQSQGVITLDVVEPINGEDIVSAIEEKITDSTYLIAVTSICNVTGLELPLKEIGRIAKKNNLLFLVDGAQGGGHIPLNLQEQNISTLCLAGHKGLCGIMGSGVLIFNEQTEISPLLYGGTGTESFSVNQPIAYPERLESGTLNLPAIACLREGVTYIKNNLLNFSILLYQNTQKIIDCLEENVKVKVYSKPNHAGIVAFKVDGLDSSEVADILNSKYDIAVRGGLHCAPKTHEYLKTTQGGLVRVSLAVQNSWGEIRYFLSALKEITCPN